MILHLERPARSKDTCNFFSIKLTRYQKKKKRWLVLESGYTEIQGLRTNLSPFFAKEKGALNESIINYVLDTKSSLNINKILRRCSALAIPNKFHSRKFRFKVWNDSIEPFTKWLLINFINHVKNFLQS